MDGSLDGTLVVAAGVHTLAGGRPPGLPRCLLVRGQRIAWVGSEPAEAPPHRGVLDLGGAWIAPAFVDAHVHGTGTGLALTGLDLAAATSAEDCLRRVRAHAASTHDGPVLGSGWDEFPWPDSRPPHADEIAAAAPGRAVLLTRVDAHSSLVDSGTLARLPLDGLEGVHRDPGGRPTGWLSEEASQAARRLVWADLPPTRLEAARTATCARAAALGIGCLHEMGHPGLSGIEDATAWASATRAVEVLVWWAKMDEDPGLGRGLRPGGDLFLDGSIGSATAAVSCGYTGGGSGRLFHTDEAVTDFFTRATRAGRGAGVHAIGDAAIEQALRALESAARALGGRAVQDCRHRIEHVEMPSMAQVERMAALGAAASVQPGFDAAWGGAEGLYAHRLAPDTALRMNPVRWFAEAGTPMAFGSDSPVTPMGPWQAVVAAERHRGGLGVDRLTALRAHTVGGRRVAGQDDVGPLEVGMRADFAAWDGDPLAVADPAALRCLATAVAGRVKFPARP